MRNDTYIICIYNEHGDMLRNHIPVNGHKNKYPMKLTVEAYRTNIVASV